MRIIACLIVKNESSVIERCLASLSKVVEQVVIVDTGSSDDTIEKAAGFGGCGVEIHRQPWVNFGHNRTEALKIARDRGDYVLMVDADQTLEGHVPRDLTEPAYRLQISSGTMVWWNTFLTKSTYPWHYEGVTHEHLECEGNPTVAHLSTLTIIEHGDGGGRPPGMQPRWISDAQALESELARDGSNTRNVFYLARTYDDLSRGLPADPQAKQWRKNGLTRYQQRTGMGGWNEEVFYSFYRLGVMLGGNEGFSFWLAAWQCCPQRWEPVHEMCRHLNRYGMFQASYAISTQALAVGPATSGLFLEGDIYSYRLLFEHSISSYYVGQYAESRDLCLKLLAMELPGTLAAQTRKNMKFAEQKLAVASLGR